MSVFADRASHADHAVHGGPDASGAVHGYSGRELVALLAGLQFAEITTGENILEKTLRLLLSADGRDGEVSNNG